MTFGELASSIAEEKGLSQNEVARRAGLPVPHVNMIFNDKVKWPTLATAFKIADALGVDIDLFRQCKARDED